MGLECCCQIWKLAAAKFGKSAPGTGPVGELLPNMETAGTWPPDPACGSAAAKFGNSAPGTGPVGELLPNMETAGNFCGNAGAKIGTRPPDPACVSAAAKFGNCWELGCWPGQCFSRSSSLEPDGDQEGESAAPLAAGHWVSRATLLGGKRRPLVPASCPEAPCIQGQPDGPGLSLLGLLASFEKKVPIPKAYVTLLSI